MTGTVAQKNTLATILITRWEQAASKLEALAEAFPEENYETKPTNDIRTFGDVLRHVAFWNQYVAGSVRGVKVDDASNELPKTEYATKARVIDALKQSAEDAATAFRHLPGEISRETTEMVLSFIEHTSEHYGQLAVYARLRGIVPPTSRS